METAESVNLPTKTLQAMKRIGPFIRRTPLEHSNTLSRLTEKCEVYIKLESEQLTGSCKARGAFNKVLMLAERSPETRQRGVIASSSGNHGLASLRACNQTGIPLTVYCSQNAAVDKMEALEEQGATVVLFGCDIVEAEVEANRVAKETGVEYISSYDDFDVIAGQGTISVEILEQLPEVDVIMVPVGGGGLISGIARYAKQVKPSIKVIGCSAANAKVIHESVKSRKVIFEESHDTLSDATAGGVYDNTVTLALCRDYVDEWILVTEEQIGRAIVFMVRNHHKIVEGSAGVSLGAFMNNHERFKGQNVVIISCGANISATKLKNLLNKYV